MVVFYNSCNITDEVYRGWVGGRGWGDVGGEWEAEGGQNHPQGAKQQSAGRMRRSLTPQAALLVPISGPTDSVVDHRGFTGLARTACESRHGHL